MPLLLTLNKYLTFSIVSIANFKQVNVSWTEGRLQSFTRFLYQDVHRMKEEKP